MSVGCDPHLAEIAHKRFGAGRVKVADQPCRSDVTEKGQQIFRGGAVAMDGGD
jgi:hypothetical protein